MPSLLRRILGRGVVVDIMLVCLFRVGSFGFLTFAIYILFIYMI